jgi:hypothetical protein
MMTLSKIENSCEAFNCRLSREDSSPRLKKRAVILCKRLALGAIATTLLGIAIALTTQKIVYIIAPHIVTYIATEAIQSLAVEE